MALDRLERPEALPRVVRDKIERLIIDGGLQPGSKLPTEKELAEKLGAGRSSVREALRAMQDMGMIEVIHGKGAFVRNQPHKAIEANLHFLMKFGAQGREDLAELRRLLEVGLVELATLRGDKEDMAAIRSCLDEMAAADTNEKLTEAGARFHLAVARAAKNDLTTAIYEAVTLVINQVFSALDRSPAQMRQSVTDHQAIYRAIASGDPQLAVAKAREHLENLDQH